MIPQWKLFRLIGLPICLLTCIYIAFVAFQQPKDDRIMLRGNCGLGVSRKQMALKLAAIKTELETALSRGLPPTEHALADIDNMLMQLDPTFSVVSNHSEPDTCPEVYTNSSYGYQYYMTGWITPACGCDRPIGELITILLNPIPPVKGNCSQYVSWVLAGLKAHYPTVPVLLADRYPECRLPIQENSNNIQSFKFDRDASNGKVWNFLISLVGTKYVLVGRGLDHFTKFARLERQISMFSVDDRVKIVGGSSRNISGHWKMGCYQVEMKNYVLEYKAGYHSSRNECAVCDYILGPFVIRTEFAKEIPFREKSFNRVLFEDFFLRVRSSGAFILNCPDVMYFSTDFNHISSVPDKTAWLPLVKEWQLNRILFPPHIKHAYTCDESNISCKISMEVPATKSFLLPPCCIEQYAMALKFMQELAEKHNFWFELDTGSALGAVKMSGVLPWDIDGDLIYASCNHSAIANMEDSFEKNGFRLRFGEPPKFNPAQYGFTGGYMVIDTPDGTIEMWGESVMSTFTLPSELRDIRTKVEMNGAWLYSPSNPGLFSRNRYGIEYLRHAQSWRHTGNSNSWQPYVAGYFQPCAKRNHHACIDRFFPDGNLQFAIP